MCYPTVCGKCKKTAWAGCGMHVRGIAEEVPLTERCTRVPWPDASPDQIKAAQEAGKK